MVKGRVMVRFVVVVALLAVMSQVSWGERLISDEQAIKDMLPGVDRVEKVDRTITDEEMAHLKARIGGMVLHQAGAAAKKLNEVKDYSFYFGIKDNKRVSVAVFDIQPGKWGPVTFILAVDIVTAKVTNIAVTAYVEKRGRPIAQRSFLSQFFGKGASDSLESGKDYRAISGATISCKCVAFVVRKVSALYEELFLNKPLIERLKDADYSVRVKAVEELAKAPKNEKDKTLQQLIDGLTGKDVSICQKQTTIYSLNAYAQPETAGKLRAAKLAANTPLTENLGDAVEKIVALAQFKAVWANDALKDSAKAVKITDAIKVKEGDTVYGLLDGVLCRYGCGACAKTTPTYAYILTVDAVQVTDLESAQKYWQEWWDSYKKQAGK